MALAKNSLLLNFLATAASACNGAPMSGVDAGVADTPKLTLLNPTAFCQGASQFKPQCRHSFDDPTVPYWSKAETCAKLKVETCSDPKSPQFVADYAKTGTCDGMTYVQARVKGSDAVWLCDAEDRIVGVQLFFFEDTPCVCRQYGIPPDCVTLTSEPLCAAK